MFHWIATHLVRCGAVIALPLLALSGCGNETKANSASSAPGSIAGQTARISANYPSSGYAACVPTADALDALLKAFDSGDRDTIEEAARETLALKPKTLVRVIETKSEFDLRARARIRILSGQYAHRACWADMSDEFNLSASKDASKAQPVFVDVKNPS